MTIFKIPQVTSTPEGTAILSTGEAGATKFLREDGDNSCSWQEPSGGSLELIESGVFTADSTPFDITSIPNKKQYVLSF